MCGIYGYLSFHARIVDRSVYDQATNSLLHRGPDECGTYCKGHIYLGMRRLSIIDLSTGNQPIWNENHSICIIYNGELYNYRDIRPDLEKRGHIFATDSDTEVILHAYEEWGVNCLERFNGMFAFAIWEEHKQILFIARDRLGEKPLYYYTDGSRFAFASEIKAILSDPSIPREIDPAGLVNFLAYGHAVAPDTMYLNIRKLLPGHYLTVQDGNLNIHPYWNVGISDDQTFLSEKEYEERIVCLLNDSVRLRMVADVPLGAFLSGGVDSSAIVALMRRHTSAPIRTFSLGFAIGGEYNELSEAKEVAHFLGTEHHELIVDSPDLIKSLETLVYHYDEPFGDAAGFPIYLLSQFASKYVKVVLSGDGGDELFGGYRRYMVEQWAPLYQRLPRLLIGRLLPKLANHFPRLRRVKKAFNSLSIAEPAARYASWLTWFTPEMRSQLLREPWQSRSGDYDPVDLYRKHYYGLSKRTADDHVNRLMYVDLKTWLVDDYLEKSDKATMAASLEARIPFLDHRLVELAFQIPSRYKIKGRTTKAILKRALQGVIPDNVLSRPKHGFAVPTDPWFRGPFRDYAFEVLLDDRSRNRGYFNSDIIERLWKEHETGRHVWDTQLWLLLNFELWHRTYLDSNKG